MLVVPQSGHHWLLEVFLFCVGFVKRVFGLYVALALPGFMFWKFGCCHHLPLSLVSLYPYPKTSEPLNLNLYTLNRCDAVVNWTHEAVPAPCECACRNRFDENRQLDITAQP